MRIDHFKYGDREFKVRKTFILNSIALFVICYCKQCFKFIFKSSLFIKQRVMDLHAEQCSGLPLTKPEIQSKDSIKLRWARLVKFGNKYMVWSRSKGVFPTLEECLMNLKEIEQMEREEKIYKDVPDCPTKLVFFWER